MMQSTVIECQAPAIKPSTPFRIGIQAYKAGKELSDFNPMDKDYEAKRAGWLYQEGMES